MYWYLLIFRFTYTGAHNSWFVPVHFLIFGFDDTRTYAIMMACVYVCVYVWYVSGYETYFRTFFGVHIPLGVLFRYPEKTMY